MIIRIFRYIVIVLGYAIIQLPDMLVSIYAYIRKRIKSIVRSNLDTSSLAQNQIQPFKETSAEWEFREFVDGDILKIIQDRVSQAELNILEAVGKKLEEAVSKKIHTTNRRIDDIEMQL